MNQEKKMKKEDLEIALTIVESDLQKRDDKILSLKENNDTLVMFTNQLKEKIRELSSLSSHYEKTLNVLSGRILEKDALISEQNRVIKEAKL